MLSNLFAHNRHKQMLSALRPKLLRVARGWCGNRSLADDLVQEASYKALKSLHKLEKSEALEGWVFTILTNCYRDFCRQQKPSEAAVDSIDEQRKSPDEALESDQLIAQVRHAVDQLKQTHREVVVLIDLGEFSYAEAAAILELPMGTVMSRLNRARQQLKKKLLADQAQSSVSYMERVK
ncbi:MAG: RNA polymerase sigma factor [Chromatiales bacterium]|nr:RNA polymerase sigma factor [Chromatiales bacterium]